MCRIAGILNKNLPLAEIESMVKGMCDLQKHGGPDDEGFYTAESDGLVLGNRRLSLLDLSKNGHMPMQYLNRYHITYNGELYNFNLLKNELIALGHQFNSITDTEVILAAYDQWGVLSFNKFQGMYAFALWDSKEKELLLVRDPLGIKPLYYSNFNNQVSFASEMRAFAPIKTLQKVNENWPVYMMAYGHIPEPITTLHHVQTLHKGTFFKYSSSSNKTTVQSFAHYSYSGIINNEEEAKAILSQTITQSVKEQLFANAPVGVFLSGGLDSSIVTMLASKHNKSNVKALSVDFNEHEYSEKKYQDLLIDKVNCSHNRLVLTKEFFQQNLPAVFNSMDMPSCDGINTWFISKYASESGLKAVLSGLGADELFGGYPSFNRIALARLIQYLPNTILSSAKKSDNKRFNRASYLQLKGIKGLYLFLRGMFSPYEIARQLGSYEREVFQILQHSPVFMEVENLTPKNQASWMEYNLYMQNQLLRDTDIMSMQHGVEIRVPFLAPEVVKSAFKISSNIKYAGKNKKQLLADSFAKDLPEGILNRSKMGFGFPFAEWLKGSGFVQNILQDSNSNTKAYQQKFLAGHLHWAQFMTLLIIESKQQ